MQCLLCDNPGQHVHYFSPPLTVHWFGVVTMSDELKVPTKCQDCALLRGTVRGGYCAADAKTLPLDKAGTDSAKSKDGCSNYQKKET